MNIFHAKITHSLLKFYKITIKMFQRKQKMFLNFDKNNANSKHNLEQLLSNNKTFQLIKVSVFMFLFHLIYTIDWTRFQKKRICISVKQNSRTLFNPSGYDKKVLLVLCYYNLIINFHSKTLWLLLIFISGHFGFYFAIHMNSNFKITGTFWKTIFLPKVTLVSIFYSAGVTPSNLIKYQCL